MKYKKEIKRIRDKIFSPKTLALATLLTVSAVNPVKIEANRKEQKTEIRKNKKQKQVHQKFVVFTISGDVVDFLRCFGNRGFYATGGNSAKNLDEYIFGFGKDRDKGIHNHRTEVDPIVAVFCLNKSNRRVCGFINHPEDKEMQEILSVYRAIKPSMSSKYYEKFESIINQNVDGDDVNYFGENISLDQLTDSLTKSGYTITQCKYKGRVKNDRYFIEKNERNLGLIAINEFGSAHIRFVNDEEFTENDRNLLRNNLKSLGFISSCKWNNIKSGLENYKTDNNIFYNENFVNQLDR